MTDAQMISLFYERSEQAIAELDKKYGKTVARVARNILGNEGDTEECVNDTYLGTWNAIPPNKPSPLLSFVCRIARNLAIARYHYNTAAKRNSSYDLALDELEECLCGSSSVEEEYAAKELSHAINSYLSKLKSSDRAIFVRRYWFSDSFEAIAEMCASTPNSIAVRLCRLRKGLRKYLMKEGFIA